MLYKSGLINSKVILLFLLLKDFKRFSVEYDNKLKPAGNDPFKYTLINSLSSILSKIALDFFEIVCFLSSVKSILKSSGENYKKLRDK